MKADFWKNNEDFAPRKNYSRIFTDLNRIIADTCKICNDELLTNLRRELLPKYAI